MRLHHRPSLPTLVVLRGERFESSIQITQFIHKPLHFFNFLPSAWADLASTPPAAARPLYHAQLTRRLRTGQWLLVSIVHSTATNGITAESDAYEGPGPALGQTANAEATRGNIPPPIATANSMIRTFLASSNQANTTGAAAVGDREPGSIGSPMSAAVIGASSLRIKSRLAASKLYDLKFRSWQEHRMSIPPR